MRYERKYRVEMLDFHTVLGAVRNHPMSFRTLFPDRQVNNIYLDTPSMDFYHENLSGAPQRKKYRIRWYGEDIQNVTDPILEVKIKDTELGTKVIANIATFAITSFAEVSKEIDARFRGLLLPKPSKELPKHLAIVKARTGDALDFEKTPYPVEHLRPTLVNTYLRSYYISYDGRYRLTVDRKMRFYSLDQCYRPNHNYAEDDAIVIEVKYEEEHDQGYDAVGQHIPFRLTKNSKYVHGVMLTGNV